MKKNVRERSNFLVHFIREKSAALFAIFHAHRKLSIGLASLAGGVGLFLYSFLGMEFLPQLNEGAIYIRATLPQSISLDESVSLANRMRRELLAFPEVRQVLSQTGRPNDGTMPPVFIMWSFMSIFSRRRSGKADLAKDN